MCSATKRPSSVPAAAQLLDNAVVRDGLTDHEGARDSGCNTKDVRKASQRGAPMDAGKGESSDFIVYKPLFQSGGPQGVTFRPTFWRLLAAVSRRSGAGPRVYPLRRCEQGVHTRGAATTAESREPAKHPRGELLIGTIHRTTMTSIWHLPPTFESNASAKDPQLGLATP